MVPALSYAFSAATVVAAWWSQSVSVQGLRVAFMKVLSLTAEFCMTMALLVHTQNKSRELCHIVKLPQARGLAGPFSNAG